MAIASRKPIIFLTNLFINRWCSEIWLNRNLTNQIRKKKSFNFFLPLITLHKHNRLSMKRFWQLKFNFSSPHQYVKEFVSSAVQQVFFVKNPLISMGWNMGDFIFLFALLLIFNLFMLHLYNFVNLFCFVI